MNQCVWWEQVSAAIDGELDETQRAAALAHSTRCIRCSQAIKAADALPTYETDSNEAPNIVGLTTSERRWLSGRWTRRLLLLAAIVIISEAVPDYFRDHGIGTEPHAARYLATWQIGFGVGLLVAAWASRLTHAMLAFAATYGLLTFIATGIDVAGGHGEIWRESVHVIELVGVCLLWRITPPHLLPWRRDHRRSGNAHDAADPRAQESLRLPTGSASQEHRSQEH